MVLHLRQCSSIKKSNRCIKGCGSVSIKVLIVDDSAFMRVVLSKLLEQDSSIQVIGTARNGREAVERVKNLRPDVVTMDIEMPELNGIDALKTIMKECPTPVIMLSSHTKEGAETTLDGLKYGAFDFLPKPDGLYKANFDSIGAELLIMVKSAAKTQVQRLTSPAFNTMAILRSPVISTIESDKKVRQIVAIGTSTGGPRALETVLSSLPANISCPILIVQHMPPNFTKSLANRLNDICQISVVESTHNQLIENGVAYIAPGGSHMGAVLRNGHYRIPLSDQPKRNEHRPSVDVLFESVAELPDVKKHYVLMTGMGNDGAQGMLIGKQNGASSTIAESQKTCIVYGMPKAAIELNCVDQIVPLPRIGAMIIEQLQRFS